MVGKEWSLEVAQKETNPAVVFTTDSIDKIVGAIEQEISSVVLDASTANGRKQRCRQPFASTIFSAV